MIAPRLKEGIILAIAASVAVWLGTQVAQGELLWPMAAAAGAVAAVLSRVLRLDFDVIAVGLLIFGYLAGGRGFAQFSFVPGLPLLPAESVLALALTWRVIRCALERRLPGSGTSLDGVLLVWLVVGGARFLFDVRAHGFLAIRDFAMVYYALFFFIVADMAREARARSYLIGSFTAGVLGLAVTYPLSRAMPDLFLRDLVINGAPLIYHKDDLVQTFFAAGGMILFLSARGRSRIPVQALAVGLVLAAMGSDVRAAMLGAAVALVVLGLAGRWRFAIVQSSAAVVALGLLALASFLPGQDWAAQRIDDIAARAASLVQLDNSAAHQRTRGYKIDNNRFRLVWWRSVAVETATTNPVFGLGFGHDLGAGFLRDYDQEIGEEFLARSPHNVAVTVFGRMGAAGGLVWVAFCGVFAQMAWRGLRSAAPPQAGQWAALLVVLVSAFFGVVLEGPMGAVPFWVLLALAATRHGSDAATTPAETETTASASNQSLPARVATV